jgi:hypothetical protein
MDDSTSLIVRIAYVGIVQIRERFVMPDLCQQWGILFFGWCIDTKDV